MQVPVIKQCRPKLVSIIFFQKSKCVQNSNGLLQNIRQPYLIILGNLITHHDLKYLKKSMMHL